MTPSCPPPSYARRAAWPRARGRAERAPAGSNRYGDTGPPAFTPGGAPHIHDAVKGSNSVQARTAKASRPARPGGGTLSLPHLAPRPAGRRSGRDPAARIDKGSPSPRSGHRRRNPPRRVERVSTRRAPRDPRRWPATIARRASMLLRTDGQPHLRAAARRTARYSSDLPAGAGPKLTSPRYKSALTRLLDMVAFVPSRVTGCRPRRRLSVGHAR